MEPEQDNWLNSLAAEIRATPHDDPAARERIMRAVRDESGPGANPDRFWSWLIRPRFVPLSPLGAAALLVLAIVLSLGWFRTRPVAGDHRSLATSVPQSPDPRQWPTQFVVVAPGAAHVSVVGDFNNWDPRGTPLRRSGQAGVWSAVVALPAGIYSYSYMIDGRLDHPHDEPATKDEFGGGKNSVVIVGKETL
jgi:hypothetical protein